MPNIQQQPTASSGTDYQVLPPLTLEISISSVSAGQSHDEAIFRGLAETWKRETGHLSVLARRYAHPSYALILNMGLSIVPFILKELQREPDRWFDALERLTKQNPAKEAATFDAAVESWLAWGRLNNYIS